MQRSDSLYMDSRWRAASNGATVMVINPAIGEFSDQLASAPEGCRCRRASTVRLTRIPLM